MFGFRAAGRGMEHVGMQAVDDEPALLLIQHDVRVTQDAQMMGDVDDLHSEQRGQFADIARPWRRQLMIRNRSGSASARSIRAQWSGSKASVMAGASRSRKDGTGHLPLSPRIPSRPDATNSTFRRRGERPA